MKWLLIILIFNSTIAIGQTEDSTKYIWYKAQYGQRMPRSWWDSVAHMPYGDTATFPKPTRPGAIMMHIDKHFYKWNGGGWDAMGGGSATLSNQGSGFRLVKTSNGQLKTLVGSYGVLPDSSSNTDAITLTADTSSTNHLITQSDLNDTAAVLRAFVGAGGGEANTASNQGSGTGLFKTKSGVDLQFKSLTTSASVTATSNTNDVALQLVNDESTPSRWRFYGTNLKDSSKGFKEIEENFLGTIYSKSTWSDLADFVDRSSGASVSGGKLSFTGGSGTFTKTLEINYPSMVDDWEVGVIAKVLSKDGTSYGFGVGKRSINTFGSPNAIGRFVMYTGTGSGTTELDLGGSNTASGSSSALSFSVNDSILLVTKRHGYTITVTATNITTKAAPVTTSYNYSTNGSEPFFDNTGRFSIFNLGGNFRIDSIYVFSTAPKNARLLIIGDSKMQGFNVTSQSNRLGDRLNVNYKSTIVHAGGYDRTIEASATTAEVLALRPQQVLNVIGSNDIRQGAESAAVIYARYDSITTALTNAGIDVYHLILKEASVDLSGLANHIIATYPGKYIDCRTDLQLTGAFDGDGVHLTDYATQLIYNRIVQSGKLYGGNTRYGSGSGGSSSGSGTTNAIPKFTSSTVIGNSSLSDDGTRITSNLPVEVSGTGPGVSFNRSSSGTDEKIWHNYSDATNYYNATVNDARSATTAWLQANRTGTAVNYVSFPTAPLLVKTTTNPGNADFAVQSASGRIPLYLKTNTDYNLKMYYVSSINNIVSMNDANTTGRDLDFYAGQYRWWNANSGSFNERMRLTAGGNLMIGSTTDNSVGKLQVNGKVTIATADSAASPANMLWIDPNTKEIKKAAVPTGGTSDLTGGAIKTNIHIVSDADYTVASTDYAIIYSTMSADRTLTLPSAASSTNRTLLIRQGGGGGSHSLNLSISVRENASVTVSALGANESVMIVSDGTDWWVVQHGN